MFQTETSVGRPAVCAGDGERVDRFWTGSVVPTTAAAENSESESYFPAWTPTAQYIDNGLETYLRCNSFWLDHHRPPNPDDHLPSIGDNVKFEFGGLVTNDRERGAVSTDLEK